MSLAEEVERPTQRPEDQSCDQRLWEQIKESLSKNTDVLITPVGVCVCVCVNRRMGQCVDALYLLCPLLPSKRSKTCNTIASTVCKRERTVVCNPGGHTN